MTASSLYPQLYLPSQEISVQESGVFHLVAIHFSWGFPVAPAPAWVTTSDPFPKAPACRPHTPPDHAG